jgi:hypothetical protein
MHHNCGIRTVLLRRRLLVTSGLSTEMLHIPRCQGYGEHKYTEREQVRLWRRMLVFRRFGKHFHDLHLRQLVQGKHFSVQNPNQDSDLVRGRSAHSCARVV